MYLFAVRNEVPVSFLDTRDLQQFSYLVHTLVNQVNQDKAERFSHQLMSFGGKQQDIKKVFASLDPKPFSSSAKNSKVAEEHARFKRDFGRLGR